MKPIILIAVVAIAVMAVAAFVLLGGLSVKTAGGVACTEEAKLCPDGTAVGRTGPNCEFAPCPTGPLVGNDSDAHGCKGSAGYSWCEAKQKCLRTWEEPCETGGNLGGGTGLANPASVYCEDQGGTLEIVDTPEGQVGMCHFANGQVCEEWALFRSNATNCTDADGSPARTYCKPEQRGAEICTMEYRPVCGWTAGGEKVQTYSNPCMACSPEEVAYWTEGECPSAGPSPR